MKFILRNQDNEYVEELLQKQSHKEDKIGKILIDHCWKNTLALSGLNES